MATTEPCLFPPATSQPTHIHAPSVSASNGLASLVPGHSCPGTITSHFTGRSNRPASTTSRTATRLAYEGRRATCCAQAAGHNAQNEASSNAARRRRPRPTGLHRGELVRVTRGVRLPISTRAAPCGAQAIVTGGHRYTGSAIAALHPIVVYDCLSARARSRGSIHDAGA